MTINETSFFRDLRPFETLRTVLLPPLIESRRRTHTLRFWSAACSTGQEAYSLAMLFLEHFPMLAGWNLSIEGTDLNSEVVERAQAGRYHRIEINRGLPARCVVRFFDHVGEDWMVKPEVRKLCNFRHANLCGPKLPFCRSTDRFDVIFLRNVMLYFSQETRRALAGRHSPPARSRRRSLSRLQRTACRSFSLDSCARLRHLPLPPPPGQLTRGG